MREDQSALTKDNFSSPHGFDIDEFNAFTLGSEEWHYLSGSIIDIEKSSNVNDTQSKTK